MYSPCQLFNVHRLRAASKKFGSLTSQNHRRQTPKHSRTATKKKKHIQRQKDRWNWNERNGADRVGQLIRSRFGRRLEMRQWNSWNSERPPPRSWETLDVRQRRARETVDRDRFWLVYDADFYAIDETLTHLTLNRFALYMPTALYRLPEPPPILVALSMYILYIQSP